MPNRGTSFSGRTPESKLNSGANQWSSNQLVLFCCPLRIALINGAALFVGTVNLKLPKHSDTYKWNKVTTCVHNVFGGQRWVDQYGELVITSSTNIKCKLTFVRVSLE